MRINLVTLAAAAGLALLATSISAPGQAGWADPLTTHMWANKPEKRQGSNGTATPGRPGGGWFEYRFGSRGGEAKSATSNETTTTHAHGSRLGVSIRSQVIVHTPRMQLQIPLKR
jgi:hypothetical protein